VVSTFDMKLIDLNITTFDTRRQAQRTQTQHNKSMESRPLLVLYGTQTGCAQEVAERIVREGKRRHFKTRVCGLGEYDKV
jgi:sulfite reductase alpha subunit-like flavoprotein